MGILEGLFGGGGSDPADIYGDLFTDKQRAALRDQQMTGLLGKLAGAFAAGGMPSRMPIPLGSTIGAAAAAGLGGEDEAMNRALNAMKTAEAVRGSRQQRGFQAQFMALLKDLDLKEQTLGLPRGTLTKPAMAASSGAPTGGPTGGPLASNAPPPPPAAVPPDIGDIAGPAWSPAAPPGLLPIPPAPPGGRITPADYEVTSPPPDRIGGGLRYEPGGYGWKPPVPPIGNGSGLLPTPPQDPALAQFAGLLGGRPPPPFGSDGADRPIDIEPLSGEAAPVLASEAPPSELDRLSKLMKVETVQGAAPLAGAAHLNYGGTGALGNPSEAGWRNSNIVPVPAPGGATFNVHRAAAPDIAAFLQALSGLGYKIDPKTSGGYNYRNIRGSNQLSEHAYGTAIDVNSNANLYTRDGRKVTDLPPEVGALAARHNLEWGGNWKDPVDTMHFQWRGPGASAPAPAEDSLSRLSQLMQVETLAKPATGGGREARVKFWTDQGAPQHVAEGIADRVQAESGFRPDAMGDQGTSGGLYQHHADRLARLQSFAAQQDRPWTDPGVQDQFAATEVKGGDAIATRAWPAILAAPDRQTAAKLWDKNFERSKYGPGASGGAGRTNIDIEPLGGEAAPAGAAPSSGLIPGLNVTPQRLAILNAMAKVSGLGDPFGSLLETYYKSPDYLRQKAQVEKDVEVGSAGALEQAKRDVTEPSDIRIAQARVAAEMTKDMGVQGFMIDPKTGTVVPVPGYWEMMKGREDDKQRLQQEWQAKMKIGKQLVVAPDGKSQVEMPMTDYEVQKRLQQQQMRGTAAPQPGDIVGTPYRSPEQTGLGGLAQEEFKGQLAAAKQAATGITQANNILDILKDGALIGPGSDLKIGFKRFAQLVNEAGIADIRGANDADLLANTEAFVSGMGHQMVAVLKSFVPASNVDVKASERIVGSKEMTLGGLRQIMGYIEKHGRKQIVDYNLNLDETLKRSPIPNSESLVVREPPRHGANIAVNPETGVQMWEKSPGKWVRF